MINTKLPSEHNFGILFVVVFVVLEFWGIYKGWSQSARVVIFVVGFFVGLLTFFAPKLLRPFNLAWFWLGYSLGMIVRPMVLGVLFFGMLTPVAFIARLCGRDELKLKRQLVASYWINRSPPGPTTDSFNNQF